MVRLLLLTVLIFFLTAGCEKEESPATSGEATLSSERFLEGSTYSIYGFSFEQGKVIKYNPSGGGSIPDFFILPKSNTEGDPTGALLDTPNQNKSFSLTAEMNDSLSALQFFNEYKNVIDSNYFYLADPLEKNQVWTYQTSSGKFGKILIEEVKEFVKDNQNYAETTFRWNYQPNGSLVFN